MMPVIQMSKDVAPVKDTEDLYCVHSAVHISGLGVRNVPEVSTR